ncbi:MAG: dTMP kinase [Deltaproteobacteria bacterium RIFCSPLOWO2_02_56_12]|nr:MAG: dTMP kinase [Deltaproteobacteria bacterium RIFCSPLOWO2_02_56_12]OGQ92754.1 MAG: dTMP kinase [Deltaproteobacteria bacterium RIFOXYA2_FULL_55_11]
MVRLISFEGGDGSGKTTQLKLLDNYLASRGKLCLSTREPGGTTLGEMIRKILLEAGKVEIAYPTELFLYLADRAQHVHEVIRPALASGRLVLCDRFTDSTLAYQGYGRGVDLDMLRRLNQVASHGITPDVTFLLDCPVEVGLSRTAQRNMNLKSGGSREDRFEQERADFHERVRRGFLELARAEPQRIYVLDASRPTEEVHHEIKKIVDEKLRDG